MVFLFCLNDCLSFWYLGIWGLCLPLCFTNVMAISLIIIEMKMKNKLIVKNT